MATFPFPRRNRGGRSRPDGSDSGDWLRGAEVTGAVIAVQLLAALFWPTVRDVSSVLVLSVIYASFTGGLAGGCVSGALTLLYCSFAFSTRRFFHYDKIGADRLVGIAIVIPLAVGLLEAQRRLVQQLRRARLELESYAKGLEDRVRLRTEELAESVRSLQEVSSTIAHDLRNPVRYIVAYSELLDRSAAQRGPDRDHLVARIRANASRMENLIDDLLRYTHLHHLPVKLSRVALEPLIDAALARLDPEIRAAGARVHLHSPFPSAWANAEVAEDAFAELVANAVKFARPGEPPLVEIAAESRPEGPRLIVADRGIGIPPELRSKLFRPFERLHPYGNFPGTGIGLAIVAKAMRQMGGSAGAEGNPGGGARFWLQFRGSGEATEVSRAPAPAPPPAKG